MTATEATDTDELGPWLTAEAAWRDANADAYWRTVARDNDVELAPDIAADGPYSDYAGNLVDEAGDPLEAPAFDAEEVTAKADPKPKASRSSSRPRSKK